MNNEQDTREYVTKLIDEKLDRLHSAIQRGDDVGAWALRAVLGALVLWRRVLPASQEATGERTDDE